MNADATSSPMPPPAPVSDLDSHFFWDGLRDGKILLQRCTSCSRFRFPPMPRCPFCRGPEASIEQISGRGEVYSWIVAQRAFAPEFAADVPYVLATVDFDAGCRAVVRVEDGEEIDFGDRVEAVIVDHPDWSELRVRLSTY